MPNESKEPTELVPEYKPFIDTFQLEDITSLLAGDLENGLNVCYECCDRHVGSGRVAIFWEGSDGSSSSHTFDELRRRSAQFSNLLKSRGVQPGDRVACMLPRIPDLFVVALGTWRAGAVYVPLFTAFGSKAIEYRLQQSEASLVITDGVNRDKLNDIADLPDVMMVTRTRDEIIRPGDIDLQLSLSEQSEEFAPVMRTGDDPFLLMFTSGTVGTSKGVPIPLKAIPAFIVYMKYGIGLRENDQFWNMADPGWAYGLFYAVVGPLLLGNATHFYEGSFSAESTYKMLEKYNITVLVSAPTAYRMLMASGDDLPGSYRIKLRAACSGGEPLNPEAIRWIETNIECAVGDHYGQTEVGMLVCNHHGLHHKGRPGSMGLAMPGFRMVVLNDNFEEVEPGNSGKLAIDTTQSPLYSFQGYQGQNGPTLQGAYYLTGDNAELGLDGILTFMGRADDIILSAGYRIGPFDVESCLIEHPAVAESGVIGKPDQERGEIVMAFVILNPGYTGSPELAADLQKYTRTRLSAHAYPREVIFVKTLPKTPSGKIQRFILRQQVAN